ncbi:hypothetical protein [Haloechinothrix halophila]|uniref:hypothetical protein n=1 Tax=Haloechinothrix halophila TaxID=1069073 RepID=UPI0012FA26A1|nr:hypothetical protein [Haloechinothrix halophila]
MAAVKQERASRARRWCLRALTVVGGSIAASVAAWAMTTATASADHDSGDNSWLGGGDLVKVDEVVSESKQALRDGVHRVDGGVDRVQDALRTNNEPGPAKDDDKDGKPGREDADNAADDTDNAAAGAHGSSSVHQATGALGLNDHMHATADGIAAMLDGLFALDYQHPGRGDLGLGGALDDAGHLNDLRDKLDSWFRPAADDVLPALPGGITDGAAPMPMPAPSVPAGVGGSVSDNPFLTDSAIEQATPILSAAGGSIDRAANAAAASDVTDSPSDGSPVRLPAGAPAAPSAPANGGATGGHADGSQFAVTSGSGLALIAASATKALTGASVAPVEPGRQPGVTPD